MARFERIENFDMDVFIKGCGHLITVSRELLAADVDGKDVYLRMKKKGVPQKVAYCIVGEAMSLNKNAASQSDSEEPPF